MNDNNNKRADGINRPKRSELPVVTIKRAYCPDCGSFDWQTKRSERGHDGSVTRYTHCRECGQRFFVVVE